MPQATTNLLWVDGLTDVGNRRQNNEDAWWAGQLGGAARFMEAGAEPLRIAGAAPTLLLVSDGIGGANAGEVASQMAVSQVSTELAASAGAFESAVTAKAAILAVLMAAHESVLAKSGEPGCEGMGATLSLLCLSRNLVHWGQSGDSRIYLWRRNELRQISRDHSPVGRLRQEGKITEEDARRHPFRSQIDLSLGDPLNSFNPDAGCEDVRVGDLFLLCSDGLSDGLWDREIAAILGAVRAPKDVRPAVEKLVADAKQASGRDNITAVLAFVQTLDCEIALVPSEPSNWWQRLRKLFLS